MSLYQLHQCEINTMLDIISLQRCEIFPTQKVNIHIHSIRKGWTSNPTNVFLKDTLHFLKIKHIVFYHHNFPRRESESRVAYGTSEAISPDWWVASRRASLRETEFSSEKKTRTISFIAVTDQHRVEKSWWITKHSARKPYGKVGLKTTVKDVFNFSNTILSTC